jgi:hypothetical protein
VASYGEPPPPPAYYYVPPPRVGYVWVDGYWGWNTNQWAWRPGYWVTERPNYAYVQGRWYSGSYHQGYWQPSQTQTYVRDHRGVAEPARVIVPSQTVRQAPPAQRPAPRRNSEAENTRDHRH